MEIITVDLGENSYPIYICNNQLHQLGEVIQNVYPSKKALIVTNTTVEKLYGTTVVESLQKAGIDTALVAISDGETYKTLETASQVYDAALNFNLDRKSLIVALGGGVVGDLAGFVAATYMRGIPFVQVPTTLLAQVDSSVGGKVAVNHPRGKNIIGSFYQPKLVFADIATLQTLPQRELKTGLAEVIKYGVIWDADFFSYLENQIEQALQLDTQTMTEIVKNSCTIKAQVVAVDEREMGLRAILNYGHTFGHAIETLTNYQKYRHGEAVGIGMVWAANLAAVVGLLPSEACQRIVSLVEQYGLPTQERGLTAETVLQAMYHDKKANAGQINYVLPTTIGTVELVDNLGEEQVKQFLERYIGL